MIEISATCFRQRQQTLSHDCMPQHWCELLASCMTHCNRPIRSVTSIRRCRPHVCTVCSELSLQHTACPTTATHLLEVCTLASHVGSCDDVQAGGAANVGVIGHVVHTCQTLHLMVHTLMVMILQHNMLHALQVSIMVQLKYASTCTMLYLRLFLHSKHMHHVIFAVIFSMLCNVGTVLLTSGWRPCVIAKGPCWVISGRTYSPVLPAAWMQLQSHCYSATYCDWHQRLVIRQCNDMPGLTWLLHALMMPFAHLRWH